MSVEGTQAELGEDVYYSATPKTGYRFRGNAPFPTCYHVVNNAESGNLTLDNQMRDIDHKRQHEAIGGR